MLKKKKKKERKKYRYVSSEIPASTVYINKYVWLHTGLIRSMLKVKDSQKNYINNEVIMITSACVCARVESCDGKCTHTHTQWQHTRICTHTVTHKWGFPQFIFSFGSSLHPQVAPFPPSFIPLFIPLFIHYFCYYIVIPFYNIYPFIPIRKKNS